MDVLYTEGANIFLDLIFLLLINLIIRRKWLNKFLNIVCLFSLYNSIITFMGYKFQSKIPSFLANILIICFVLFLIVKSKKRKETIK